MKPFSITLTCLLLAAGHARAELQVAPELLADDAGRIETISRFTPAVVAVFDARGEGGGSAVIVSPDGYALTNFHVVAPCGVAMKCGLPDGEIYDAVVVGVDPVGDVALIQLLGRDDFPTAPLGDSDTVGVGDWVYVAGNPFLLADDLQPSVSYGIVSGVRRYQYPAGTLLEYTDCIQTDAAINPGNSGGPLFDDQGRVIGVNGRASFEKRGRVNVGVGYAISVNQVKRFLPMLKSGRVVDHASLAATVATGWDGGAFVDEVLDTSDAYRRGLRYGDQILRFAGREIRTANALQNILGTFPRGWTVEVDYLRDGEPHSADIRLAGLHREEELFDLVQQEASKPAEDPLPKKPGGEEDRKKRQPPAAGPKPIEELPDSVAERYTERRGYANYWYNLQARKRLWENYLASTDLDGFSADWSLSGIVSSGEPFRLACSGERATVRLPQGESGAVFSQRLHEQLSPPGSGGLLLAVHLWQRLLAEGPEKFGEVYYLGALPLTSAGEPLECLVALHGGVESRFFFHPSGALAAVEAIPNEHADPCVILLDNNSTLHGKNLPLRWTVVTGDTQFAVLEITGWADGSSPSSEEQ